MIRTFLPPPLRTLLAIAGLCALAVTAAAQTPAAPPPAEAFYKPPALQRAFLSPSGARLAVTVPTANGRFGLVVIDLQDAQLKGTRAAQFTDADVDDVWWVDDERLVFDVTDLQAGLGDNYRDGAGLYAVRHDGSELLQLIERRGRAWIGEASRYKTLPWNHGLLRVPAASEARGAARADEIIVGEWNFDGDELRLIKPLWLNTRTARTRTLGVERVPCDARRWWFNAQGEPRAIQCGSRGRESLHWLHAARDGAPARWQQIAEYAVNEVPFTPLWVGQGDRLYVAWPGGTAGESVVSPFDFATGKPGPALVSAPGFDFLGELIGDRRGENLLGVEIHTDAEQTLWFAPAYAAAQQRADQALPGRINRIQCRRCGSDDAVMLVQSYSDRDPGQLFMWRQADDGGKGRWQRVGVLRPDIRPEQMGRTSLERIRARDGRDLPVWLTRPPGSAQGPLPAVVLVHGGPWVRGRTWAWSQDAQFLASRGYLVIEPEFRGSAGYGQAHLRAGNKQWGQAMQDDVADALLWARQKGLANDAACIVGGSYGGYSTLMGLIRHPELYRCGSAWVAVTDLFLFLQGAWWVNDDIGSSGRRYSLPEWVGDADKDREMLTANSPLAQAARIQRPLQLMWGNEDLRVPIVHGTRLREAMRRNGQEPEWIVYDGEAHGLRKTENRVDFALKLQAFLDRHLKPAAAATAAGR